MSATTTPDQPRYTWTMSGIAFTQIAQSISDLQAANAAILGGDDAAAHETTRRVVAQLEIALGMLR